MRKELIKLREKMKAECIDVYIIPTTDFHGSEYVNDHFKCREYISGFTGSAGTLIIKQDFAGLWTDGRYFIQAAEQLVGSGIELMKMGQPGVPTIESFLDSQPQNSVIGFDGRVMDAETGNRLAAKYKVIHNLDIAGEIWENRPKIIPSKIYELEDNVTGESYSSKIKRIRQELRNQKADYILISRLEEIAWLYNLRGADIANTPVFYSFALISMEKDILYVMDNKYCPENMEIKGYDEVYRDLTQLKNCRVILDKTSISYSLFKAFDVTVGLVMSESPVEKLKAIKNDIEIRATKAAHIRDGAAMAEFICWLKNNVDKADITEISAADYLENCRRKHGAYDLSFTTIAGYEEHGAIVHYAATHQSDVKVEPEGFILVDSGGQYKDGTTDITRTIAFGSLDEKRKQHYTAVLKGNIALAQSEFEEGTTGAQLDEVARKSLKELGLDFNHGTGHGVGHLLSVHEGPNSISPRAVNSKILPGMITSDEPGVYFEGEYGIRIENEILCVRKGDRYGFEVITFCPFEKEAIDVEMLTDSEIRYINKYHQEVYDKVSPLLNDEVKTWLAEACSEIQR